MPLLLALLLLPLSAFAQASSPLNHLRVLSVQSQRTSVATKIPIGSDLIPASAVWNPIRLRFYAAVRAHGYYESPDGVNWTRLANQPGNGPLDTDIRGVLAVQPVSGDMFAWTVDPASHVASLWQATCAKTGPGCASDTVMWDTQIEPPVDSMSQSDAERTLAAVPASVSSGLMETLLITGAADSSGMQHLALRNLGRSAMQLGNVTASSNLSEQDTCADRQLEASDTCTLSARLVGANSSTANGTLHISADVDGGVVVVALAGAAPSSIVLTPDAKDFGTQLVGTTSAVTNITISNVGTQTVTLNGITASGDFALRANTCGTSLATHTGCTVSVVFMPTATGTRSGALTVVADVGTQTATLTGTGASAATDAISPLTLSFAQQQVGTGSAAQFVKLTNNGDLTLTLVSAQILAGDFTVTNGCGPTVAAHSSCNFAVSFAPRSIGALTGVLQIADVQRLQTVALSGVSVAGPGVTLTPANLTFAHTGVGVAGAGQTLTLTNNGGLPLQLAAINVTGDFGIVAGTNTCSPTQTIAVGGSCSMSVAFLPAASGVRNGTVTITGNAPTQSAQLTGTGIDFSFNSSSTNTQTISSGGSASYALLLRPAFNTSDPVTYACSGAPANSKCTVVAQYSDLSAISTVTVTVLTGTTAKSIRAMLFLPLLLAMPWCAKRRRVILAAPFFAMLFLVQGCGSNRTIAAAGDGTSSGGGSGGSTPTASGTYNLTVSATAAGASHTVPLILIVR